MRAGALKYQLSLLEPQRQTDKFGHELTTYVETCIARAERVRYSGKRSEEVGEHWSDYTAEWNIRDYHTIEENWRVQQLGGHLYKVVAIYPNRDRGFLTLVCQRVNE